MKVFHSCALSRFLGFLQFLMLVLQPLSCPASHPPRSADSSDFLSGSPLAHGRVPAAVVPSGLAANYLAAVHDQFHTTLNVYTDADAAGNHFAARGRMSSNGDGDAVIPMVEDYGTNPQSGLTCIKCQFVSKGLNWGGWYFMNGILQGTNTAPSENWGDYANAGVELSGATQLRFFAKGEQGGERVEFFALGVGWDPDTGMRIKPYPDSSPKVSLGWITLSSVWTQYTLDLSGRDLRSVLGGFGWVSASDKNSNRNITFYIDQIQYNKVRTNEPHFLLSFETTASANDFDRVARNVAFVYDNAVALLALLFAGDVARAKLIADALVYAQGHDRFYKDGRLRNAYQAGDLILPPGWKPNGEVGAVRTAGFSDKQTKLWKEDEFDMSTHAGNIAWAMLALLSYYQKEGGEQYLTATERMGDWIEINCRDEMGAGGYTAGFDGWEPTPRKLTHKATEHNIDLYAAFQRLFLITNDQKWHDRAEHAKAFVLSMWDSTEGKFWTGTGADGVTIFRDVIPVDIQAWALLSFRDEGGPFLPALQYAETHHKVDGGYDFNQDRDAVWFEGTGQMAVAYRHTCQRAKSQAIVDFLKLAQLPSGGIFASTKDGLTTGFTLNDGQPWLYFRRVHIAPVGWLILADLGINPFWGVVKTDPTISSANLSFAAGGGSGRVDVTAPGDCVWTVSNNNSWITITSSNGGTGNGSVTYSVAANISTSPRSGTIDIEGNVHTVYQGAQFNDIPSDHVFYTFIGKLSARSITQGCGGGNYCPDAPITREQMAVFIIRARGEFNPPQPTTQRFADVPPSNPFYAFIDRMAALGITQGCGGGNYCPSAPVTREQMAAFIIRARGEFSPPLPASQRFLDVPPSNVFYNFIDRMAALGITSGCGNGNYCPSDNVTRGQMAVFIVRAFGL